MRITFRLAELFNRRFRTRKHARRQRRERATSIDPLESRVLLTAELPVQTLVPPAAETQDGVVATDYNGELGLIRNGSRVFFVSQNAEYGEELWVSDGTEAGTRMVTDLTPGSAGTDIEVVKAGFGGVIFSARRGNAELWFSDGTEQGTERIHTFSSFRTPTNFVTLGSKILFRAYDNATGYELWETNGSANGTQILKDINPGTASSNPGSDDIVRVGFGGNARVYFSADDGTNGIELWVTDGTEAGTTLVRDISPGSSSTRFSNFYGFGGGAGTFIFQADTSSQGREPWISDGTEAGTTILKNIRGGGSDSNASGFRSFDGLVYFSANDGSNGQELWVTDLTETGTQLFKDIRSGSSSSSPAELTTGLNENGDPILFFTADNGTQGRELWRTDGTSFGSFPVADINPGANGSNPTELVSFGGKLYLTADNGVAGRELWQTNGTAAGTSMVQEIAPDAPADFDQVPTDLLSFGSSLLFIAGDGVTGRELWSSFGTEATTQLVKDTNPTPLSAVQSTLVEFGGDYYYIGYQPDSGRELWKLDGSTRQASLVKDIYPGRRDGVYPGAVPVVFQNKLWFTGHDEVNGYEFWTSDGTETGTTLFTDFVPGTSGIQAQRLTVSGSSLFFAGNSNGNGFELMKTDGTVAGTVLVADIDPGGSSSPNDLIDVNGKLFFTADDDVHGDEVWVSDGTAAGTFLLQDIDPGDGYVRHQAFTSFNGKLYFVADDPVLGEELWVSDGTVAGTYQVIDINPGAFPSQINSLHVINNKLWFAAYSFSTSSYDIYTSDGTAAGTQLLFAPGSGGPSVAGTGLIQFNGDVYFSGYDSISGSELYKTDGTVAGTSLVSDLTPGPPGTGIQAFVGIANNELFFRPYIPALGYELYRTDGTAAGTGLVKDLNPGTAHGYTFFNMTPGVWELNSDLAFFGTTPDFGTTLYTVQSLDYGDAPAPYPTTFEDDGARHRASNLRLGSPATDSEYQGQPEPASNGDGTDDAAGIIFQNGITPGTISTITARVRANGAGTAKLNAWVDFNGDGDWNDFGEQIFNDRSLTGGDQTLTFPVPSFAIPTSQTFARFRISNDTGLSPTGFASDGEVEDHAVGINSAPIATDDTYSGHIDQVISVSAGSGVLANDADLEGNPLTASVIVEPVHGAVTLNSDGSFDYEPDAGFIGSDGFQYRVSDGNGGTDTAFVQVTINPVVDAANDSFTVSSGSSTSLEVVANDGPSGVEVQGFEQPPNGSVTLNTDGTLQFAPDSGFSGSTGFEYTLGVAQSIATASDAELDTQLGYSVAVDGQFAVAGAPLAFGNDRGAAYVFRREGNSWEQVAKLGPSDAAGGDKFGWSVDISDNTIVVSSHLDDDNGNASGSAYVFVRDTADGTSWSQVAKLNDPNGSAQDKFGWDVAIYKHTIVVGSPFNDTIANNSGSAFVFSRNLGGSNAWGLRKAINSSDAAANDQFGYSVDIQQSHVVVGARFDDDNGANSGSAYVFRRMAGGQNNYGEVAKLLPVDGAAGDQFGTEVGIDSGTVIVGAPFHDAAAANAGAAWMFGRTAGGNNNWGQEAKLLSPTPAAGDQFGTSVGISSDGHATAIVGSALSDLSGNNAGAAFVFDNSDAEVWSHLRTLTADDAAGGDNFGRSVAVSGRVTAIGSPRTDHAGNAAGTAYLEDLSTDTAVADITVASSFASGSSANATPGKSGGSMLGTPVLAALAPADAPTDISLDLVFQDNRKLEDQLFGS